MLSRQRRFILLLLCMPYLAVAQHAADERHYPDSLLHLLSTTTDNRGKARILFLLSDYWSNRDTAKALGYIRESTPLCGTDQYCSALMHFYLAGIYFEYNSQRSQQEYLEADKLLSRYQHKEAFTFRSRTWNNYGVLEQQKDNSRGYLHILLNKALPFALKAGDSVRVALNYMNIGLIFLNQKEYPKAQEYLNKAIPILENSPTTYADLSDAYVLTAKAFILNQQAAAARSYLDKAAAILGDDEESPYLPLYYVVEGMYYNSIDQQLTALKKLRTGLDLSVRLHQPFDTRAILYELFVVYKRLHNYEDAKQMLLEAHRLEQQSPLSSNRQQLLFDLADIYQQTGRYKEALQWLSQYTALKDSIYDRKTLTEITALETRFRTAEKEKQILRLEHERKLAQRERKYQQLLYWSLIGGLMLLSLIVIIQLRHRRKAALKKAADLRQELSRVEKKRQLSNYAAMLEGQEQERRRVARDLHDGLGCRLSAVKLNLSGHTAATTSLHPIIDQLDVAIKELRWISRNMMPESLLKLGLEAALQDLCSAIRSPQLRVVFNAFNIDPDMPSATQVVIFRMIQEIMANAVKHAGATTIMLQCSQSENIFLITAEDNGIGFNVQDTAQEGLGLKNIRNRVDYLKGNISIDSSAEGTNINIELNVTEEEENSHH